MKQEVLRLENVTTIENGAVALDNLNLQIFRGEIMGLLVCDAFGIESFLDLLHHNRTLHYGKIYYEDQIVNHYQYSSGKKNPVAVISGQSSLIDDLSVADNLYVLHEQWRGCYINKNKVHRKIMDSLSEFGLQDCENLFIRELTSFQRCEIELIKALIWKESLIVLREPGGFLSQTEQQALWSLMKKCVRKGHSFLYVCSHHEEAFSICDRLAIFMRGRVIKILSHGSFSREHIRPLYDNLYADIPVAESKTASVPERRTVFEFRHLCSASLHEFCFALKERECLTILDRRQNIIGELVALISGRIPPVSGTLTYWQQPLRCRGSRALLRQGLCFLQEDFADSMYFPELSPLDNLCFLLNEKLPFHKVNAIRSSLLREIDAGSLHRSAFTEKAKSISPSLLPAGVADGGKTDDLLPLLHDFPEDWLDGERLAEDKKMRLQLVCQRVLLFSPKVLFMIQPFLGADMIMRRQIIRSIRLLQKRGCSVLIFSMNLSDCLLVSDRLIILNNGRAEQTLERADFKQLQNLATVL